MVKVVCASGKRKTAIARAILSKGKGRVRFNKIPVEIVEPELIRLKLLEPLMLAGSLVNEIDIDVEAKGGGFAGQADAARTAIARGLVEWTNDSALKEIFLAHDRTLLVNDVRLKEPKKMGGRGARKRRQKSYR
ncbi:MAG: 30S ribosomal protein S9 [Halobacteria archaeon]